MKVFNDFSQRLSLMVRYFDTESFFSGNSLRKTGFLVTLVSRFFRSVFLLTGILFLGLLCLFPQRAMAEDNYYENLRTGYFAVICDVDDLLSVEEETELLSQMEKVTEFGSVCYYLTEQDMGQSDLYAEHIFTGVFGEDKVNAVLFYIDKHYTYIYSDGNIYKKITKKKAEIITDNVYEYAVDEDYFGCGMKAFDQIFNLLEFGRVPQPMKHICNLLISLILGFLICYLWVIKSNEHAEGENSAIIVGSTTYASCRDVAIVPNGKVDKNRQRHSGSGYHSHSHHHHRSGGGSFHGGGGHRSSHRSGGGGGHRR